MKTTLKALILGFLALVMMGCEENTKEVFVDYTPAAPQGVYSITGSNAVYLYWNGPYERDIDYYLVYRSNNATTGYVEIGGRDALSNPNLDLIIYEYIDNGGANPPVNGQTYYYAVASVDNGGHVSELSAETVFDTPRPEGTAVILDAAVDASIAGYDLSAQVNVDAADPNADVYVDRVSGVFYLNVADALTDLQDVGYTNSFDDIGYAPTDGWSENGWAELILGHTYIVWTRDLNYAKMRVESINASSVSFSWAYQTDPDNPELIVVGNTENKPVHGAQYLNMPKGDFVPSSNGK